MAAPVEKQESQDEFKQDQFDRLSDDLVLLIINKLFHVKTLVRFSLVAKRYSSLVSQTHSLFVDFSVQVPGFLGRIAGFLKHLVAKLMIRPSAPTIPLSVSQKISAITHSFQQIKYLHLHLCVDGPSAVGLGNGHFSRWVAVFGSHLELCHFLIAASVNRFPSNPSVDSGNGYPHGLDAVILEYVFKMLKRVLENASVKQMCIRRLVSQCKMIETAVFSENCSGGALIMGKQQIAKLQGNQEASAHPAELRVFVFHMPTLDLPESGYTLNDVVFVSAVSGDQDVENVELMGSEGEEMADVAGPDGLDLELEKWDVFLEAVELILNENKEPLYDSLIPYEQWL